MLGGERKREPALLGHLLPDFVAVSALVVHHRARVPDRCLAFQVPTSSIAQVPLFVVQVEVHIGLFRTGGLLWLARRRV